MSSKMAALTSCRGRKWGYLTTMSHHWLHESCYGLKRAISVKLTFIKGQMQLYWVLFQCVNSQHKIHGQCFWSKQWEISFWFNIQPLFVLLTVTLIWSLGFSHKHFTLLFERLKVEWQLLNQVSFGSSTQGSLASSKYDDICVFSASCNDKWSNFWKDTIGSFWGSRGLNSSLYYHH